MSETMTDASDLVTRIAGYLAARPQYARTFYAGHPEVMLKEAADRIEALEADRKTAVEFLNTEMSLRHSLTEENERLRTALTEISAIRGSVFGGDHSRTACQAFDISDAALTPPSPVR